MTDWNPQSGDWVTIKKAGKWRDDMVLSLERHG